MLNLSATDDVGITGYYASENSMVPTAGQAGWVSANPARNYSANPSFTFSAGDGTKTIYAWYKDAAGNISNTSTDSINLIKNDSWKNNYEVTWRDLPQNQLSLNQV